MEPCYQDIPKQSNFVIYEFEDEEAVIKAPSNYRWHHFLVPGKAKPTPNLITDLLSNKRSVIKLSSFEDLVLKIYWNYKQFYVKILKRENKWNSVTGYILITYISLRKLAFYCQKLIDSHRGCKNKLTRIKINALQEMTLMSELYTKRKEFIGEENNGLPDFSSDFIQTDYLTKTDYDNMYFAK